MNKHTVYARRTCRAVRIIGRVRATTIQALSWKDTRLCVCISSAIYAARMSGAGVNVVEPVAAGTYL